LTSNNHQQKNRSSKTVCWLNKRVNRVFIGLILSVSFLTNNEFLREGLQNLTVLIISNAFLNAVKRSSEYLNIFLMMFSL
jgi:hypothetical protein